MKRNRTAIFFGCVSLTALHLTAARADECPLPKGIRFLPMTDAPLNGEPRKINQTDPTPPDCPFYQWAWQTFLYATDQETGAHRRRLLEYPTFKDVFGVNQSPFFAASSPGLLSLAPRTIEHSNKELAASMPIDDLTQAQSDDVLIELKGNPVWYQIHLNPTFRDFVVGNKLNDKNTLKNVPSDLVFRTGSVEFKSAWKIIDHDSPDYITADAVVPVFRKDPASGNVTRDGNRIRRVKVGLLALHVVGVIDGHPEFIWATFEHTSAKTNTDGFRIRDLAPSAASQPDTGGGGQKIVDLGIPYQLYKGVPDAILQPPVGTKLPALSLDAHQKFAPVSTVFRVFPVSKTKLDPGDDGKEDGAVLSVNKHIQDAFEGLLRHGHADPRRNYSLVGAVWLNDPAEDFKSDRDFGDIPPQHGFGGEDGLSSAAMESFTQMNFTNCFACHDTTHFGGTVASRLNVSHVLAKFLKSN